MKTGFRTPSRTRMLHTAGFWSTKEDSLGMKHSRVYKDEERSRGSMYFRTIYGFYKDVKVCLEGQGES